MNTFETLAKLADKNHGYTLQPWQVRQVVGTLINIDAALNQTSAIINEYIYQHGTEVLDNLVASATITQDMYARIMESAGLIEGEIVDEEEGQTDEDPGLHASSEVEGDVDVPDTVNDDRGEGSEVEVS